MYLHQCLQLKLLFIESFGQNSSKFKLKGKYLGYLPLGLCLELNCVNRTTLTWLPGKIGIVFKGPSYFCDLSVTPLSCTVKSAAAALFVITEVQVYSNESGAPPSSLIPCPLKRLTAKLLN